MNALPEQLIFFGGIGIVFWFWGFWFHRISRDQVFVPSWVLRFCGGRKRTVSSIGLALQIFAVAFVLWAAYVFLMVMPGEASKLVWQRGCLGFAILSYILARLLGRKSYDYRK